MASIFQDFSFANLKEHIKQLDQYAAFAEFLGSFLFMFFGGACVANSVDHGLGVSALGNGFAYTSLVFAIAAISGGHMNPAISAAMVATNRMTKPVFVSYVISQVFGAVFGALFLHWCLPKAAHAFVTSGAPHTNLIQSNVATAMLWEFIMTFTLVFVLFAVNYHKAAGEKESELKGTAPIALGLCLIVATFAGGPFTGASLNPARAIAPAVVFGHWSALWAYLIATIGGGVAGGYVYENLFIDAEEKAVAGTDYSAVGGSATLASA